MTGTTLDGFPDGAGRRDRKRWLNWLTSGSGQAVASILPVLQKFSQSRATKLVMMRVIMACVIAVIWAFEVAQAFGFPVWGAIVSGFVVGFITWLANSICVTSVVLNRGPRRPLREAGPAIVVAVIIGTILSFAATMQLFHEDALSEWLRSPAIKEILDPISIDIQNREENVNKLNERMKDLEGKDVDENLNVTPLVANYRKIKGEYNKANEDFLCALNIHCVTKGNNKGISLDELGGKRNALQLNFDLANRKLNDAEQETRKKIDEENGEIKRLKDRRQELVNNRSESFRRFLFRSGEGWAWFIVLLIFCAAAAGIPAFFLKDDLQNKDDNNKLIDANDPPTSGEGSAG